MDQASLFERVLLTGAAGFVGFHVTQALLDKGVQVLGIEDAIRFILAFGGSIVDIRSNPRDSNEMVQMFGREAVEALAALTTLPRRIPLAKPWLATYFHSQGLSIAQIARKLRISDVSVRNHLRREAEHRDRLSVEAERRQRSASIARYRP